MSVCLCVRVCFVCAKRTIEEKKLHREGARGWTQEKRLLLLSLSRLPPPLHTHIHWYTHTWWSMKSHRLKHPLVHSKSPSPSSANVFTELLHPLDLDRMESSWIFFIATLSHKDSLFCYLLLRYLFLPPVTFNHYWTTSLDTIDQPVLAVLFYVTFMFTFLSSPLVICWLFYHLKTITCTNMEMVWLSDQTSSRSALIHVQIVVTTALD